jgi:YegS/Rv2252/BmrU family lipid kinase
MEVSLIVNPVSGNGKSLRFLPVVLKQLMKSHTQFCVYQTKKQGDAIKLARGLSRKSKLIIVIGGDGTINEVINGAAKSRVKMGIIPAGTENVLAQEFKIPFNPVEATKIILKGKTKVIDLGKAKNRYFVLMSGVGFDAHVAAVVRPQLKRLLGSKAYYLTTLEEIFKYKHTKIYIDDGKNKTEGYFVIVGNAKSYGARIELTPKADMCDGYLDVCLFKHKELLDIFRYIASARVKMHTMFKDVERWFILIEGSYKTTTYVWYAVSRMVITDS